MEERLENFFALSSSEQIEFIKTNPEDIMELLYFFKGVLKTK